MKWSATNEAATGPCIRIHRRERDAALEALSAANQLLASRDGHDMIQPIHILALSNSSFVKRQLSGLFCSGECDERRDSLWRGWSFQLSR